MCLSGDQVQPKKVTYITYPNKVEEENVDLLSISMKEVNVDNEQKKFASYSEKFRFEDDINANQNIEPAPDISHLKTIIVKLQLLKTN
jgi:hypothetical protein